MSKTGEDISFVSPYTCLYHTYITLHKASGIVWAIHLLYGDFPVIVAGGRIQDRLRVLLSAFG